MYIYVLIRLPTYQPAVDCQPEILVVTSVQPRADAKYKSDQIVIILAALLAFVIHLNLFSGLSVCYALLAIYILKVCVPS